MTGTESPNVEHGEIIAEALEMEEGDSRGSPGFAVGGTLRIALISAANIGSMLLFQWLVLTKLGPGIATDALFAAMTIPQIFASVVSSSITQALAPLLAGEPKEDQRQDGWTLVFLCGLLFAAIAALLAVSAPLWVRWVFPGFGPEGRALTVLFAEISAIGIVFTGLNAIQTAIAFAHHRFIWSDAAPMLASLVAVAILLPLLPIYGAVAAAWITVGRLLLQSLLLSRGMGRPLRPDFSRPTVHILWARLKPLILGASYYKMDPLVDRFLLSSLAPGALSIVYLAQQLHGAGSQVVSKALAMPAITRLAAAHKSGDERYFVSLLRLTFAIMAGVCAAGVVAIAIGRPLIGLAMVHGNLGKADAYLLWLMLLLTSGQLVAGSIGNLTAGAFYAAGDTKTPTWLGTVSFTIAIFVKVAAFHLFGLVGLALAISFYYMQSLTFMTVSLYRRGLLRRPAAIQERP
jgi:putative peptidoglycan lipid II flippase